MNPIFCYDMVLGVGICKVAGVEDECSGGQNGGGDGGLCEVHEDGGVFRSLHVGSGEGLVQNSEDSGELFGRRKERYP